MKTVLFAALLFILASGYCTAGSLNPESAARIRTLTLDGLNHAYNFDFTTANRLFDEAIAAEPLHPRPYIGKTSLALWQFLLSKNDADYKTFLSLADRSIETGERYLDTYGEDAEVFTCLGMAYGYRAFAYGRASSYLKAAWDGKKSYDYLYDALKLDPHTYDAYLGIGIFHYFTTFIAKPLRWIVSILGITGDSELGIKEIRIAAEKGLYTKAEAQYYLAQFLPWQEGDFTTSEKIINDLLLQYPENSILKFTLAVWEIRRHNVLSAKVHLTTIVQQQNTFMNGIRPFVNYKLAECYFRLSEYDEARTLYQALLKEHKDETYSATSNYRIGLCCEMMGQREMALPFYKRAIAADRSFGDDAYSARRAEHRLKMPLSATDTALLQAQNALRSGAYGQSLTLFSKLKTVPATSPDILAEAIYGIGETEVEQSSYAEALQQFQLVLSFSVKEEQWLIPWSHYQSALCYLKLGQRDAAHKEFEKVLDYDNYDFKNWLTFRTERELAKFK